MTKYIDVLKKIEKKHICPFCNEKKEHMLECKKHFYVMPARSPYTKDHLLIIPKRHVYLLQGLTPEELKELFDLLAKWDKKLHTQHKNISLLLRDGMSKKIIGKSINHLHFNLIPDHEVHVMSLKAAKDRNFYNDKNFTKIADDMRTRFK